MRCKACARAGLDRIPALAPALAQTWPARPGPAAPLPARRPCDAALLQRLTEARGQPVVVSENRGGAGGAEAGGRAAPDDYTLLIPVSHA